VADEPIILGVDGGGSKTEALVIDTTGRVLGTGQSGGANHQTLGMTTAQEHIRQAAAQALKGRRAPVAVYCLAGADLPPDFVQLEPALRDLNLADEIAIYNDVLAVFRAGSDLPFGMAVTCGAGFNAGGIGRDGREVRLPAQGVVTGDCAGGEHLGQAALGAAFRAWDGRGAATCLQERVLQALDVPDMSSLAERIVQGQVTTQQIIALAPLVFSAAVAGDAVARRLIRDQGREIGVSIVAILRRLDLLGTPCQAVLGGSIFYGEGPLLMNTIQRKVRPSAPLVQIKRLDTRPVVGAVLLAADRAGITTDEGFITRLRATLPDTLKSENDRR
jgi:N-acetylglucosamine kinase-like BadF-type ATPase